PGLRRSRAAGALAALAAAVLTFALSAGPAWAAGSARAAGPTIGPVQINPVGHPRLCWQAGGNGSGVTLERCDPAPQGQQWSLTVADAASARAAYGVAVTFSLSPHLFASGLHVTGAAGWTCDVRGVTCTGTLPSGASGTVAVTGRLPAGARPGHSYIVRARAA